MTEEIITDTEWSREIEASSACVEELAKAGMIEFCRECSETEGAIWDVWHPAELRRGLALFTLDEIEQAIERRMERRWDTAT